MIQAKFNEFMFAELPKEDIRLASVKLVTKREMEDGFAGRMGKNLQSYLDGKIAV